MHSSITVILKNGDEFTFSPEREGAQVLKERYPPDERFVTIIERVETPYVITTNEAKRLWWTLWLFRGPYKPREWRNINYDDIVLAEFHVDNVQRIAYKEANHVL